MLHPFWSGRRGEGELEPKPGELAATPLLDQGGVDEGGVHALCRVLPSFSKFI